MSLGPEVSPAEQLNDQAWSALGAAVRRLEEAWHTTGEADLAQFLPLPEDPLYEPVLAELVKVDQEYRWASGHGKRIEAYLADWPELARNPRRVTELLEAECITSVVLGTVPTIEELRSRFPEIGDRIDLKAIETQVREEGCRRQSSSAASPRRETRTFALQRTPSAVIGARLLKAGDRFGRYEIRAVLGQGGMGTVYQAYDPQLDIDVALKIPRPTADPVVLKRFLREAQSVAKVRHANVCPIYDIGEVEGTHYISMGLVDGPVLSAWLENRQVPARRAAELVHKLALALAQVHACGIVHRDVKPSNVMIDDSGEPVLMDFGLARPVDRKQHLTSADAIVGTFPYMSLEQIDNAGVDFRSDVYSLGVLLYQLLTGRLPYRGTFTELVAGITEGKPAGPRSERPDLDADLEAICLKAMARDPSNRYQTSDELAEALGRYLEGLPQRAGPPVGRRWSVAVCGAAAMLLVASVVIYLRTGEGTLEVAVNDADVRISIDGKQIPTPSPCASVRLSVGRHELEVIGSDGVVVQSDSFTIRWRGERVKRRVPGEPSAEAASLPLAGGEIHGSVWNDVDGNRRWDRPQEEGLEGWKVYLDENANGYFDSGEPSAVTDGEGHYAFTALSAGIHRVGEILPNGWEQTEPSEVVYETDFSSDPVWITNNAGRFHWDASAGTYYANPINVNHGGHYVYREVDYHGGSFSLRWDVLPKTVDYATDLCFGMVDHTGALDTTTGRWVRAGFHTEDRGRTTLLQWATGGSADGRFSVTPQWSANTWHSVVLEYDDSANTLEALVTVRDTGERLASIRLEDAGPFAGGMNRVGCSQLRHKGQYQVAGAEAAGSFDNVRFSVSRPRQRRVRLSGGQLRQEANFGNRKLGEIRGAKWNDLDGDGVRDPGEPGLKDWRIYVDENLNGQWDKAEPSMATDADGRYRLTGLTAGTHIVAEAPQDGWKQTCPHPYPWKQYGSHLFALTKDNGTWQECEHEAIAAGGHLVTVDDAAENAWLAETFVDTEYDYETAYKGLRWIGLKGIPDDLSWASGEPVGYVGPRYLDRWSESGASFGYLAPRPFANAGDWWNSDLGGKTPPKRPHGIIELAGDVAGPVAHRVTLVAGEVKEGVDFGSVLRASPSKSR